MTSVPTDQQLIDFVVREARLLDQQRLEDWLDLFTEDGHYWMPVEWSQTDPKLTTSLMYEDKLLLRIRDDREGRYITWTPMHYVESRAEEQTLYAAWVTHHLTTVDGALKIRLKRVD